MGYKVGGMASDHASNLHPFACLTSRAPDQPAVLFASDALRTIRADGDGHGLPQPAELIAVATETLGRVDGLANPEAQVEDSVVSRVAEDDVQVAPAAASELGTPFRDVQLDVGANCRKLNCDATL